MIEAQTIRAFAANSLIMEMWLVHYAGVDADERSSSYVAADARICQLLHQAFTKPGFEHFQTFIIAHAALFGLQHCVTEVMRLTRVYMPSCTGQLHTPSFAKAGGRAKR